MGVRGRALRRTFASVLETIGYEPAMARWVRASDARLARVVRVDDGLATVVAQDGPHRAGVGGGLLARMARDLTEGPVCGDWCVLRRWPDHRLTLERVLPRRTTLLDEHGRPACANVDLVALVATEEGPGPLGSLADRVWESGARPLVVQLRPGPPVDLPEVEALDLAGGVGPLRERLEGRRTLALLGSTPPVRAGLVDALVGAQVLAVRRRGRAPRRGLVPLPGGGAVIDPPGPALVGARDGERAGR
jgi:ribosome biogenesis GTPase